MKKTNEFRDLVAKEFLRCVNESPREWKQGWFTEKSGRARNAATNKPYKGINLFYLKMVEMQLGFNDNRWATFKQIKDNGWKLQKGSKGYKVEYWFPLKFDSKTGRRKAITWNEYAQLEDDEKKDCTLQCKYFTVFNASQIEGIPETKLVHNDISESEVVGKISKGLGVDIEHSGGDMAYYSPGKYTCLQKKPFLMTMNITPQPFTNLDIRLVPNIDLIEICQTITMRMKNLLRK